MIVTGVVLTVVTVALAVWGGIAAYRWISDFTAPAPSNGVAALSDEQLARALLEQSGGAGAGEMDASSPGVGSMAGVVNYQSLREQRHVPCSGSDVYVLEEPLPDHLLQPGQLLPSGDNLIALQGGYLPLPIAHGTVDGSGRYSISGIPAGEHFVYCHNANSADTVPADRYRGHEWREEPYVMVRPGEETTVDFRF
ncbi:MAG: hypothetical protein GF320_17015 [Armatimonadia bacterium]|nr:hypothetical protein [Armatimonadia bacterium]